MREYIDTSSILSEAKMMWTDYHEAYVLVEGKSDKTFFTTLLGTQCNIRFRPVNGWEQVHKTILLAQKEAFTHILGVIDSDYHQLIQDGISENSQLFFTDGHDIEMMLFFSSSYEKFLVVCANENKLKAYDNTRYPIAHAASYLGALRAISLVNHYNFLFDGFECKDYVDRNTLSADCKKLIEKIVQRTRSSGTEVKVKNDIIEKQVESFIHEHGAQSVCNGHDVLEILCIAMVKLYASLSSNQYSAESLFDYLLMGYSKEEFQKSTLSQKLNNWIRTHIEVA